MKRKKSFLSIDVTIYAVLGVFVLLILFIGVPRLLGKGTAQASDLLSSTSDYDNDGVADYFDKCACIDGGETAEKFSGCRSEADTKGTAAAEREKLCHETIKKATAKK